MKTIISVTTIISLFLLSCDRNNEDRTYRIIIENESGQKVNLNIYDTESKKFIKTINIPNTEIVMEDFASSDMGKVYGVQDFFEGDSLDIIYGDSLRIKSFKCRFLEIDDNGCTVKNNIANDGVSKWQRSQNGILYESKYIFTKDDLLNAQPCNGNCD